MIKTGGNWNRAEDPHIYFLAGSLSDGVNVVGIHKYILIAVNELNQSDVAKIKGMAERGAVILIDSGIYALAMRHAGRHGMTLDQSLNMAPADVDGFQDLLDKYKFVVSELGSNAWGYIELDLGGRENKLKTRVMLEGLGFRPIPVYHPFGDGWDYFDYLAEHYDRICLENTAQAEPDTRKRLIATVWERKRKYPDLWIHVLGYTPNELLNAFPVDSCDSSAWLSNPRYGTIDDTADGKTFGVLPYGYIYDRKVDILAPNNRAKGLQMAAYQAKMQQHIWRTHLASLQVKGAILWPPTQ